MTSDEFKKRLAQLREAISRGVSYYTVWKGLIRLDSDQAHLSVEDQTAVLGRFYGFFTPVGYALLDMSLLQFAKTFDTRKSTASLTVLLKAAEKDSTLVPHAQPGDLREISREISESQMLLDALKQKRDQELAHIGATPGSLGPLLATDFDKLVEVVKLAFNSLAAGHDQSYLSWEHSLETSEQHTAAVLEILLEQMTRRRQEFEEEMVRIGLDQARRAEVTLGHPLDKETLASAIGTLGLTKEQMQRVEKEYLSAKQGVTT